jgi:hypothetical protein
MRDEERYTFDERTVAAIAELQATILRTYPEATFSVERSDEEPEMIHLYTTANVEDLTDLIELTLDRQSELLVDDGIAIYVIPSRTPKRYRDIEVSLGTHPGTTPAVLDKHQ